MTSSLTRKVEAKSLVDVVTERLETAIFKGDLEPGSRLSEQGLAKALGVSRGPLREAIRRLEGRRLVQRKPNVGVHVVDLTLEDFREILQVQEVLQGLACALAARNMEDEEIKQLRELARNHSSREKTDKRKPGYRESDDVEFHTSIMNGSRNERLAQMLSEDLYFLVRANRYKFTATSERIQAVCDEHEAIVDAIEKRDPELAERKMREHIASAWQALEAQVAAEAKASGEGETGPTE